MIEGKWFAQGADLTVPLQIRKAVFGTERDALDDEAQQAVVYIAGRPVGTGRLWWRDGAFWLSDVGVLPEARGQGQGDLLVRLMIFKAMTHQATMLRLLSPVETEAFFARYGFEAEGETEGGTLMSLPAERVCLSHCGCC